MKCTIQTKVRLHAGEGVVQMTVQGLQVPEEPAAFQPCPLGAGEGQGAIAYTACGPCSSPGSCPLSKQAACLVSDHLCLRP